MPDQVIGDSTMSQAPPKRSRSVCFKEVEVIEFAIVAGENHPSQFLNREGKDNIETDDESNPVDSAAITLDWEAQARTRMDLDTYEEKQKKLRVGKKLKRMSRAVRKRILRNIGVETSDIESEDERSTKKKIKKKRKSTKKNKTSKKSGKGKRASAMISRINPFSSNSGAPASPISAHQSQDRFASSSDEYKLARSDHAPSLPQRQDRGLGLPPRRANNDSDVENGGFDSPQPTRQMIGLHRDTAVGSPQSSRTRNFNFLFPNERLSRDSSLKSDVVMTPPNSPPPSAKRQSHLGHVTNAIGVLAKQPVRLAKQPVRLAKYTTKKVRKGVDRVRRSGRDSSDDDLDFGPGTLPPSTTSGAGNLSSDDEFFPASPVPINGNDFFSGPHGRAVSSSVISDSEDDYSKRNNTRSKSQEANTTSGNAGPRSPSRGDSNSRRSRRSSLSHVTNAIGVLAKQPVKLAKQPVRLAKYTTKKVRKRVVRARNRKSYDDDDDEDSLEGDQQPDISKLSSRLPAELPTRPPFYDSSDDDRVLLENDLSAPASRISVGAESGDEEIEDSDLDYVTPRELPTKTRRRRSSLQHVTTAIGTVAKQPYKLAKYTAKQPYKLAKYTAKQPIKLAKFTGKSIRKRLKKRNEDSDIVSDSDDLGMSEDDNPLDLEPEESPPSPVPPFRVIPQRLLSPIIDVSDYNSSQELSPPLDYKEPSNESLDLSDVMIDDLEDASEDEDIVEPEADEVFPMSEHNGGSLYRTFDKLTSRRISMTGEVFPSGEFSPDDALDDLIADVDQEDMDFLEAASSMVSESFYPSDIRLDMNMGEISPVLMEKKVIVPISKSANPQDTAESDKIDGELLVLSLKGGEMGQQGAGLGGSLQILEE